MDTLTVKLMTRQQDRSSEMVVQHIFGRTFARSFCRREHNGEGRQDHLKPMLAKWQNVRIATSDCPQFKSCDMQSAPWPRQSFSPDAGLDTQRGWLHLRWGTLIYCMIIMWIHDWRGGPVKRGYIMAMTAFYNESIQQER